MNTTKEHPMTTQKRRMTLDTPKGPATFVDLVDAKAGGKLIVVRHRNGATWMYAPGDIETRTAADTAWLDSRITSVR